MQLSTEQGSAARNDAALLAKAQQGDNRALSELYEATYPEVYRTIRTLIRSEDDALDILQDSYIKAFSKLSQLKDASALRPWLRQIAANTARDYLRSKKPTLFSELTEDEAPEIEDDRLEALPEAQLDQKETGRLLRQMLDELSDEQRLAVGMYYYVELPVKEIASRLGVSQNTVKSQLRYGRQKIETKVRALERQGVKLYGLSPLLFFRAALRQGSFDTPDAAGDLTERIAKGGAGVLHAASGAGMQIKTLTAKGLLLRRIAAVAGAAVLVGGAAVGIGALLRRDNNIGDVQPTEYVIPTVATESAPAETVPPAPETQDTAPETQDTAPTEPAAAGQTYDYAELTDEYSFAALVPDAQAEDYPLVHPDLIELLQRRREYPDDQSETYIRLYDLDGDGAEEAVITLRSETLPDYREETVCGLYAIRGGEIVQLLGAPELRLTDRVEFFEGGLVLRWENGRYTSPCQVTVYRLERGASELTEVSRWTCTVGDDGYPTYYSADGTQTWDAFGFIPEGRIHLSQWHCRDKGPNEYGFEDDLPFVTGSHVGADAAVMGLADAKPEYAEAEQRATETVNLLYPYITLSGADFAAFNRSIEAEYEDYHTNPEHQNEPEWRVGYYWAIKGDILSIQRWRQYNGVDVYNFSISRGKQLSDGELLAALGVSRQAAVEAGKKALQGAYLADWEYSVHNENMGFGLNIDIAAQSAEEAVFAVDRDGQLLCIGDVGSLAGGDRYLHAVPVYFD